MFHVGRTAEREGAFDAGLRHRAARDEQRVEREDGAGGSVHLARTGVDGGYRPEH